MTSENKILIAILIAFIIAAILPTLIIYYYRKIRQNRADKRCAEIREQYELQLKDQETLRKIFEEIAEKSVNREE